MSENNVKDKDLEEVSGGYRNSDNTFSFKKGEKIYTNMMRNWYYVVNDDYNNVKADAIIEVTQCTYPSGYVQGDKTIAASDLQYCIVHYGKPNN